MTFWESIILGIIQGLTEFLPVSSSGHLVLTAKFLGIEEHCLIFDLAVHLGSLAAVVVIYRKILAKLFRAAFKGRIKLVKGKVRYSGTNTRLLYLIIMGTIPAALAGFFLESIFEATFKSPILVAAMLLITGTVLFLSRWAQESRVELNWFRSLLIGISQALAIIPGLSRSGLTITTGMFAGLKRKQAADFSFLLSVPVILGATAVKFTQVGETPDGISPLVMAAGTLAAAGSGYAAIRLLLKIVADGGFYNFAWYCWAIGLGSLFLLLS